MTDRAPLAPPPRGDARRWRRSRAGRAIGGLALATLALHVRDPHDAGIVGLLPERAARASAARLRRPACGQRPHPRRPRRGRVEQPAVRRGCCRSWCSCSAAGRRALARARAALERRVAPPSGRVAGVVAASSSPCCATCRRAGSPPDAEAPTQLGAGATDSRQDDPEGDQDRTRPMHAQHDADDAAGCSRPWPGPRPSCRPGRRRSRVARQLPRMIAGMPVNRPQHEDAEDAEDQDRDVPCGMVFGPAPAVRAAAARRTAAAGRRFGVAHGRPFVVGRSVSRPCSADTPGPHHPA